MTNKNLWYFGCIGQDGHYWFGEPKSYYGPKIKGVNENLFKKIDGTFPPGNTTQGVYNEVLIEGVRIVSWWDYSVDKRPGSNSNLVGIGYESGEEMIEAAKKIFPQVMSRQPRPVPASLPQSSNLKEGDFITGDFPYKESKSSTEEEKDLWKTALNFFQGEYILKPDTTKEEVISELLSTYKISKR